MGCNRLRSKFFENAELTQQGKEQDCPSVCCIDCIVLYSIGLLRI